MPNTMYCTRLKRYLFILVVCCAPNSYAVESITLNIAKITADDWSLNNAVLKITHLNQKPPQISLVSATLVLPAPLQNITAIKVHCKQLIWYKKTIGCSEGQGRLNSEKFQPFTFDLSFQLRDNDSHVEISQLSFLSGTISIHSQQRLEKWQILINAQDVDLVELKSFLSLDFLEITQGLADFELAVQGDQDVVQTLHAQIKLKKLSVHDPSGSVASENVSLTTEFSAFKQQTGWQWQYSGRLQDGGLYVEPIFLEVDKKKPLTLTAKGNWQTEQQKVHVDQFKLEHPQTLIMQGSAQLNHQAQLKIEYAEIGVNILRLDAAAPVYLLPFLEASELEGIELRGMVNARFKLEQNNISDASIAIDGLELDDVENRFSINQATARINWAGQEENSEASFINWQQLNIQGIPFQPGQLDFISFSKQFTLLKPANLAVLGGIFSIHRFSFAATEDNTDARIHFVGALDNLSLEQLSKALDWTVLTGSISGYIPSVRYQDKTLSLDGELKMQLFDGEVTIKNLASSGMFTDFAQFYTDIEFDHLDLDAITHKFDTGYIEGRLSGTVQNLYMENWLPVSFYAWIGTPDDDDSTHRISQKAVENISSIGGGGASDVLSRGFLGLFSTFGYSKLGLGCYLHEGVCQLMGVEAVDNGFYLIKGGGLPRVDVIGYNPRVDWNILINSLNRIEASDEVIIE